MVKLRAVFGGLCRFCPNPVIKAIYGVLDQVGKVSSSKLLVLWNEVMDDMYGDEGERKSDIHNAALQDDKVSLDAKNWLKSVFNL